MTKRDEELIRTALEYADRYNTFHDNTMLRDLDCALYELKQHGHEVDYHMGVVSLTVDGKEQMDD